MKIIFFAFLGLISCIQKPVETKNKESVDHAFQIRFLGTQKEFDNNEAITFSSMMIDNHEIYVSSFTQIKKEKINKFLDKRKNSFLNLFGNDVDPYTGKEIERKTCLQKINADSVEFFSGPRTSWADCRIARSRNGKNPTALRKWILCENTVWEITIKSDQHDEVQFNCL